MMTPVSPRPPFATSSSSEGAGGITSAGSDATHVLEEGVDMKLALTSDPIVGTEVVTLDERGAGALSLPSSCLPRSSRRQQKWLVRI